MSQDHQESNVVSIFNRPPKEDVRPPELPEEERQRLIQQDMAEIKARKERHAKERAIKNKSVLRSYRIKS